MPVMTEAGKGDGADGVRRAANNKRGCAQRQSCRLVRLSSRSAAVGCAPGKRAGSHADGSSACRPRRPRAAAHHVCESARLQSWRLPSETERL